MVKNKMIVICFILVKHSIAIICDAYATKENTKNPGTMPK